MIRLKVLVLSDSHNNTYMLQLAVRSNPDADAVVFLGDGADDWAIVSPSITFKQQIFVRGNCDSFLTAAPLRAVENIGGILFYCTHGHQEHVKFGLETLKSEARESGAKVALFGHTHTPYTDYDDGLYLMNPGSVRQNSCGMVNITPQGIICFNKKIDTLY